MRPGRVAAAGDAEDRIVRPRTAFKACRAKIWVRVTRLGVRLGIFVLVVAQVFDHLFDRIADLELLLLRELAVCGVSLRKCQRWHGDRVIVGR